MICKKCSKEISDDSIFCEFCGNKTKKEEVASKMATRPSIEKSESSNVIQNEKLKQMADHLGFLGYEIEKLESSEDDKRESIFARHPSNFDFSLLEVYEGFIILRVLMSTKGKPSPEIDAFLNDMNKAFVISKIYREIENEIVYLRIEAIYTGVYIKDLFAKFMDINIREHNQLRVSDDFTKLFVG